MSPADDPFRRKELDDAVRRALAAAKALQGATDKVCGCVCVFVVHVL